MRGTLAVVGLVAGRELRQRTRTRSFMLFTVFIAVAIVGGGILFRVVSGGDGASTATVAVGPGGPEAFTSEVVRVGQATDIEVTIAPVADRGEAVSLLDEGEADVAVLASTGSLLYEDSLSTTLKAVVDAAWQSSSAAAQAAEAGLPPDEISAILSPPPLEPSALEQDGGDDDGAGVLVGFGAAILLFIFVSTFGGYVLSGVVEEKTTAVIEVLLAHVRADQLLAGKVLGLGLAALVQLGAAVVAGAVALAISGADVPSGVWVALPTIVFWFIAGFALYSTLFALAGSFVSRPEDAQAAAAPISVCVLAAYLLVFVAGSTPDSTLATVLSLLPPSAPMMMPLRIATGAASVPEVILATVLLAASAYGVLHVAGRIYARTLLHRGSRIPWRTALRLRQD